MKNEDFVSTFVLEERITNRTKNVAGEKIKWHNILQIRLSEGSDLLMSYNHTYENEQFKSVELKKIRTSCLPKTLPILYKFGRSIEEKKLIDLCDLMAFIPPISKLL